MVICLQHNCPLHYGFPSCYILGELGEGGRRCRFSLMVKDFGTTLYHDGVFGIERDEFFFTKMCISAVKHPKYRSWPGTRLGLALSAFEKEDY